MQVVCKWWVWVCVWRYRRINAATGCSGVPLPITPFLNRLSKCVQINDDWWKLLFNGGIVLFIYLQLKRKLWAIYYFFYWYLKTGALPSTALYIKLISHIHGSSKILSKLPHSYYFHLVSYLFKVLQRCYVFFQWTINITLITALKNNGVFQCITPDRNRLL